KPPRPRPKIPRRAILHSGRRCAIVCRVVYNAAGRSRRRKHATLMTQTAQTRPIFTRQQLIALLLPLVAEQALSVTIGLADTLMVSSVGEAAVSGVSLVDTFNTLMIQIMSALATGGAVVTSQYIGHREPQNAKATAGQIMLVMLAFSCTVALVVLFGRHLILRAIFGAIEDDVMAYAETYFLMSALSYP